MALLKRLSPEISEDIEFWDYLDDQTALIKESEGGEVLWADVENAKEILDTYYPSNLPNSTRVFDLEPRSYCCTSYPFFRPNEICTLEECLEVATEDYFFVQIKDREVPRSGYNYRYRAVRYYAYKVNIHILEQLVKEKAEENRKDDLKEAKRKKRLASLKLKAKLNPVTRRDIMLFCTSLARVLERESSGTIKLRFRGYQKLEEYVEAVTCNFSWYKSRIKMDTTDFKFLKARWKQLSERLYSPYKGDFKESIHKGWLEDDYHKVAGYFRWLNL